MVQILIYLLIFNVGVVAGLYLKTWLVYRASYVGTIRVSRGREKTLYSLELNDYPESIEFKKEVTFKVDTSEDEGLDRK